jgi:2,5-dioxopentanoate dehydrogenase
VARYSKSVGTPALVDRVCQAAGAVTWPFFALSRAARADFLEAIAAEIDLRADPITEAGSQETGLPRRG